MARALRLKYPAINKAHETYVAQFPQKEKLLGTSAIAYTNSSSEESQTFIVCLFTSLFGGGGSDSPRDILLNTDRSLDHLKSLIWNDKYVVDALGLVKGRKIPIYMPQINSGIFNTPWKDTEKILEKYLDVFDFHVVVYEG